MDKECRLAHKRNDGDAIRNWNKAARLFNDTETTMRSIVFLILTLTLPAIVTAQEVTAQEVTAQEVTAQEVIAQETMRRRQCHASESSPVPADWHQHLRLVKIPVVAVCCKSQPVT